MNNGMLATSNSEPVSLGLPPLGFIAPRLYKVATEFPGEAFQDIPSGKCRKPKPQVNVIAKALWCA